MVIGGCSTTATEQEDAARAEQTTDDLIRIGQIATKYNVVYRIGPNRNVNHWPICDGQISE